MRFLIAFAAAMLIAGGAGAAGQTPLFSSSDPIEITISAPIGDIVRAAAKSTDPHPATLTAAGVSYPIELSARGNSRRAPENCTFPPLRVKFTEPPAKDSLFGKQKTLKLVTHCRPAAAFQQFTLLEYAVYRMYNALTDQSFRVRLARVNYLTASGKPYANRYGFFIEDTDDVADRAGMKEVDAASLRAEQYAADSGARTALFFHMIGNQDWSMFAGPEGECCHNGKVMGADKTATTGLVYLPYDFDYSGFVDTPYALPPSQVKIKSVRTRYYRGNCHFNEAVARMAPEFRARREAMEAAVRETPGLDPKSANKAIDYLAGFYKDIADDAAIAALVKKCR